MHTKIHSSKSVVKRCRWLVALASGLLVGHSALAAVTFTITPSAVSNTYSGLITLSIGGLTNTETVVVQKFLDLNTNGVIDGTDWLVQQFNLTDGQAGMVIGGVTNFNVPGDLNATPGAITAQLNFQNGDFVQNIIGKYLFKLSSPVSHFAPLTNQFAVTNFPFAQKITGNVVSNGTSTTLSNAVVLLFGPPRPGHNGPSTPQAGAVANNAGSYTIQAPPGTYVPMAFRSNYVANYTASPVLTLGSGATITTNLTSTNATASISGKVVDANNASIGLPGMMVPAMSANGLIAITFTDTNGNFNVRVTAGQWGIQADDTTLIVHGYLGLQNGTNVTAGATGVILTVPKATALFYGSVKDNLGNPLPGIDVYAYDNNNYLYQTDGYTGTNGNYVAGVLGGLGSNDPWQVEVGNSSSFPNYIFSQSPLSQNGGTNMTVGKVVLQNFTAILATNHITGHVQYNGNPVSGVQVYAYANINGVDYQSWIDTDTSGNYSLNVGNGNWGVGVNCQYGGSDSLDNILGSGNYQCPGNQNVTINNNNGAANFTVQSCGGVQILTTSLPDGQVGSYYNQFLQGSSCSGNLNWSLNDPQDFPSSLGWSGNGNIQGTPNSSGMYNFSVHLDDGNGNSTNQNLSLYIAPASTPLQVTTTFLAPGQKGVYYSQSFLATGGQPPYQWSLSPLSASLTPNLVLTANGVISGTPATNGTSFFSVRVTDSASATADQALSLSVYSGTPVTIMLKSDASTLAAAVGLGAPSADLFTRLDSGNLSNLTFQTAVVGAFGTFTPIPSGAPAGTQVINISPGDGENGFFKISFVLPVGFQAIQLAGVANVDDYGRAFLNGNPISSSMSSGDPGRISEFGDTSFSTASAAFFRAGTNELVIADANTSGGPSGAAFYAAVTYQTSTNNSGLVLGLPGWLTNQFQMRLTGASNQNYTVQMSTNLSSTNWISLFITNNTTTNSFLLTDPNATNQQRFYRILIGP